MYSSVFSCPEPENSQTQHSVKVEKKSSSVSSLLFVEEIVSKDDDMLPMKAELEQLEKEEIQLRKQQEKEELRIKLNKKKAEVKALKEIRPVVIIGDSIIKNISPIEGVKIQSFPGATIGRLAYLVSQHKIDLYDKSFIVVHVGTNNISNQQSIHSIGSDFANLIASIRHENHSIKIIISSVLP
ncbi:uncharacterized protein LOC132723282 [Ruditapes philippinarum]|uniref:uncharacterized protein LOC132723282 n=1 Tax=Ruditapes philippinarum TaxID=129788 RepID=UPI00295B7E54|nr:uncharacterized protein LOC132723282 [Ruditapes philippinarum]